MSAPVLEADHVTKVFENGAASVCALDRVTLSLRPRELTLLMGPSGSGKTTLLSILGCMLSPTSGSVRVCGTSATGAEPEQMTKLRRDHIGFVFQSYHLFPMLTALENVAVALDVRGSAMGSAKHRARDVLAQVGLEDKCQALPKALSGGEQQRVAIARAMVSDPSVILADEPTAALDTGNGESIMRLLVDLAKSGERTILVVTHDSRLVRFATRVVHIEDGRLVQERWNASQGNKLRSIANG